MDTHDDFFIFFDLPFWDWFCRKDFRLPSSLFLRILNGEQADRE
jgi:hypothetical protein